MYDHDCTLCSLHQGRRTVCVPGEGPLDAEILIVGQAPGETEDAVGRPFWGRSGQLLRAGLEDAGITKYRIENIVRCFPPGNRPPTAEEVQVCYPYTEEAIAAMPNLKVIVCLGTVPMRVFAKKTGITKWVGTPLPATIEGKIAYPVFHPAYILRKPDLADKFLDLLKGINTLITGVDHDFVRLVKGKASVDTIERFTKYSTPVAFDFETTGLDPDMGSVLDISFYGGRGKPVSCLVDTPQALLAIKQFLSSPVPKLVHNVAFESAWSEHHFGVILQNVVGDTQILAIRENCNRPSNLGTVSATFVPEVNGFKIDSQHSLELGERWEEMDVAVRGTRNAVDSYATYHIYQKLKVILGKQIMDTHLKVDLPIAMMVARMSKRGVAVDQQRLLEMEATHLKLVRDAQNAARKAGITASLTSPKQLDQNFHHLGLDTGKRTATGQMQTDETALRAFKEKLPHVAKWVDPILQFRGAKKFLGTYIKGTGKHITNGIIPGHFRFPGTVTWRLTCKRPNLLNQPRGEWRKVFISRYPGGSIVRADFSQAELRTVAALSDDPVMIRIYRDHEDIHTNTAIRFYGQSFTKDGRSRAKAVNFGVIYGGGGRMLQRTLRNGGIEITLDEADEWVRVWKDTYHVAWAYMENLQKMVLDKGIIELPNYGIKRIIDFTGADTENKRAKLAREGANTPIQGAAAMITLRAGEKLDRILDPEDGILVNLPYDELVVDSPGDGLRAAELMQDCMLQAASEEPWMTVPMEVDPSVGPNWAEQRSIK